MMATVAQIWSSGRQLPPDPVEPNVGLGRCTERLAVGQQLGSDLAQLRRPRCGRLGPEPDPYLGRSAA